MQGILLVQLYLQDRNILLDIIGKLKVLYDHHNILLDKKVQLKFLLDNKTDLSKVFLFGKF